ncbi:MAG: hypothetical protein WBA57_08685 [Elainellaceae cyanobacterium]
MTKTNNQAWVPTTIAAESLGVGREFLLAHRFDLFEQGKHWRLINPHAVRPTYRWHLKRLENLMETADE